MKPIEVLERIPYFAGLPQEELDELCRVSKIVVVSDGEAVIGEGDPPSDLLVVAEGTFQAFRRSAVGDTLLGSAGPGEVLGEMALLEKRPASATVRALGPASLVRVPGAEFERLLSSPQLLAEMFHTVIARMREREAALIQTEKLASLGTLTAGLLHEVNNPAAAISRAASNLMKAADQLVPDRPEGTEPILNPLLRADLERELAELLTGLDPVEKAEMAASLVVQGWDPARLLGVDEAQRPQIARLVHTRQLAGEVTMAAGRLSDIVATVKRWTYHDQGLSQAVDLNQSVTDSLTLLRPKTAGRRVDLDLQPGLDQVEGRGSELSQIITNLVDNALDAAESRVVVRTWEGEEGIVVEVEDDGKAGIPADLASRIWEPFFTTKPPGKGTGLGLALVQRIAADHRGRIELDSVPGKTSFRLVLPRRSEAGPSSG